MSLISPLSTGAVSGPVSGTGIGLGSIGGADGSPDQINSQSDLRKAAQAFEAIFLRQMLSSARAASLGGDELFGGPGLEQFQAMRDEHLADVASHQGVFGLAEAIERQISAQIGHTIQTGAES